jgi:hypothetical protein
MFDVFAFDEENEPPSRLFTNKVSAKQLDHIPPAPLDPSPPAWRESG